LAEDASTKAAQSITSASESLSSAAQRLHDLADASTQAQQQLHEAVKTAEAFLDATDVSELNRTLQEVRTATASALPQAVETGTQSVTDKLDKTLGTVQQQFDAMREQYETIGARLA